MVYEIFTHGGGEYVIEVLNAIVRIMGANSFVTAMRLSVIFGIIAVLCDVAMNGNFTKTIKYYFSFFLVYSVLFVPKVDVIVTDPITTIRTDRKVDNVPFGLAFNAHVISSLGNWLTNTFEMNFALPDDLQYNKTGLLFGSTVLEQTLSARIYDSRVRHNFHNFIRQCIVPATQLKKIDIEDVLKSENISTLLSYGSNGVLAFEFKNKTNQTSNRLCKDISDLKTELDDEVVKIMNNQQNKNDGKGSNNALAYITGIQEDAYTLFEQTLMMNAIEDSTQEYLATMGADAGATNYAMTKDDLQRKQTGVLQWLQANKYLPLLKITIEVMFYALFPIVILVAMLPNGFKPFKAYIMILLALQMWAPLYAILNLIMTLQQKYRINLLMTETGNMVSLYNRQAILNISQGIMTQAGVLAWSIPILSYKIIAGMQGFAEGLSGVAHSGAFTANQVASEVASGNLSYGNGSFKNTSWGNENFNNTSANQFKAMRNNFTSTEDQVNSSRIALNESKSTTESYANAYNKSMQDLQSFNFTDSSGNGKTHSLSNSDTVKGHIGVKAGIPGIGSAGIDYEKTMSWADQNNISKEDRKTLSDLIQKTSQYQTSYNQSLSEQNSKQKALDYNLATSTHSGMDWNKEIHTHLQSQGYTDEWIDSHQQEVQKMGNDFIKSRIFNENKPKMLENINNSIEISKNQNINQDNMIEAQYEYNRYDIDKNKAIKMFQNTDPTNWTNFSTTKKNN